MTPLRLSVCLSVALLVVLSIIRVKATTTTAADVAESALHPMVEAAELYDAEQYHAEFIQMQADADAEAEVEGESDAEAEAEVEEYQPATTTPPAAAKTTPAATTRTKPATKTATSTTSATQTKPAASKLPAFTRSPLPPRVAAKLLPPTISRLTLDQHQLKYKRFLATHPHRAKKQTTQSFNNFVNNRKDIVNRNDHVQTVVFSSLSPFADLTPAEFKAIYLTTTHHSKYKRTNFPTTTAAAAASAGKKSHKGQAGATAATKRAFLEMEVEDRPATATTTTTPVSGGGGTAGVSGGTGGKGGTRAGEGGGTGGKGGTRAGDGGGTGGKGGTRAGTDGADAGKGGTRAGGNGTSPSGPVGKRQIVHPKSNDDIAKSLALAGATPAQIQRGFGNFREQVYFGGLRNVFQTQEACQSCWAHTAAGAIWKVHSFNWQDQPQWLPSAQQLVDCVKTKFTNGCKGGTPMDALDWWKSNSIAVSNDYPFTDKEGTCRTGVKPSGDLQSFGWSHTIPECKVEPCLNQQFYELQLVQRVISGRQTMAIAYVDATNWQNYQDGLFPCDQCSSTLEAGNHVVEIVGWTTDPVTGVYAWYLKNSWGRSWGEKGYMKLPFGVNCCGIANWVIEANPPDFYRPPPVQWP